MWVSPGDKKEPLFRPFSQVDPTISCRYGGTGLGLAINREIVELRGGTIFCESEKGWEEHSPSTSPLKEASLEHDTPHVSRSISEKMTAAQEGEGILSVLLVEDDSTIRDILARLLKLAHYHIEIAEDGLEAIIMWKKGRYDLVLMDVQMPRLDGFEATRAIRKMERERGGHTPIVAMTAHASRERGRGE